MVLETNVGVAHEITKLQRGDVGLPEWMIGRAHFRDQGCDLAPSCLKCPFDPCRHDEDFTTNQKRKRDVAICEMKAVEFSRHYIAKHFKISLSTVDRVTALEKKATTMTLGSLIRIKKRQRYSVVKFLHKLYANSCPSCGGGVTIDYDAYSKANVLDCLMCPWTLAGKVLKR